MILISNDGTSASKKINRIALIETLTVSTIAFERKKEELYGFRQTVQVNKIFGSNIWDYQIRINFYAISRVQAKFSDQTCEQST